MNYKLNTILIHNFQFCTVHIKGPWSIFDKWYYFQSNNWHNVEEILWWVYMNCRNIDITERQSVLKFSDYDQFSSGIEFIGKKQLSYIISVFCGGRKY